MRHRFKNAHHGHHFCACGSGFDTRADLDTHIKAYNEFDAIEEKKREAWAKVKDYMREAVEQVIANVEYAERLLNGKAEPNNVTPLRTAE